jgi:hypothetical protein
MRSKSLSPLVERLKRCDICGHRATTPILRRVDYDQVELLCEPCDCAQLASFTPPRAITYAQIVISMYRRDLNAREVC